MRKILIIALLSVICLATYTQIPKYAPIYNKSEFKDSIKFDKSIQFKPGTLTSDSVHGNLVRILSNGLIVRGSNTLYITPKGVDTNNADSLLKLRPDGSLWLVRTAIGPNIYYAAGDTSNHTTPSAVGDLFIDTTNGKLYFSKGVTRGSWIKVN